MGLDFLATSLIVVISPGPGVLYTLAAGLSRGGRASFFAALGCTLGIVAHVAAAITGLAALLYASALAFQVLKYAGVAYLLYMAWRMLAERGALTVDRAIEPRTERQIVVRAILIKLLNPKLALFFFAFLPQFVSADDPGALTQMLGLSIIFMAMTFAVFVVCGLFAASVRRHVVSRPRVLAWMRRVFAAAFAGPGIKLALAPR